VNGGGDDIRHDVVTVRPAVKPRRATDGLKPMLVRLQHSDALLLQARAESRGLRPATYAAILLRSHLRQMAPLPKDELLAFKRSIAELAAIGRNINQIARVAHDSGRVSAAIRDEFRAMLKVCEALRDHTKGLLNANLRSWEVGHD
jgi:Bacterial mobilisation protein (MobC)